MSNKPTKEQLPVEVIADEWVDVPKGMTTAPGVIPHPDQNSYPGVLVMETDHTSVVRWHNKGCNRTGKLDPALVKFDKNGAPWCPTCFAENVFRDPTWNEHRDGPTNTLTPNPQGVSDSARVSRVERLRQAREAGRFRDPAYVREHNNNFGDDGQSYEAREAEDRTNIRPPERYDG